MTNRTGGATGSASSFSSAGKVVASAKSLYGSEIVYAELPTGKRKK